MILSHRQIEDIAAAIIQDFNKFFYCGSTVFGDKYVHATPIDEFARDYLRLNVRFARLSADGSICGLTSYADAEYIIEEMGVIRTIELKQNQILLDSSFLEAARSKSCAASAALPWRMSAHIKSCFRWSPRSPSKSAVDSTRIGDPTPYET